MLHEWNIGFYQILLPNISN